MVISNLANWPTVTGFTWKRIALLAAFGVSLGLVLALTVSLPVS
jgi:hypothetical protein